MVSRPGLRDGLFLDPLSHHPLADVLNAFVRTGLAIEHVAELGDRPVPNTLAIRACKGRDPCPAAQPAGSWASASRPRGHRGGLA